MNRRMCHVLQNPGDSEQSLKVALADKYFKQTSRIYIELSLHSLFFSQAGKHLFTWLCIQK